MCSRLVLSWSLLYKWGFLNREWIGISSVEDSRLIQMYGSTFARDNLTQYYNEHPIGIFFASR